MATQRACVTLHITRGYKPKHRANTILSAGCRNIGVSEHRLSSWKVGLSEHRGVGTYRLSSRKIGLSEHRGVGTYRLSSWKVGLSEHRGVGT